jgi:hypothetical protein
MAYFQAEPSLGSVDGPDQVDARESLTVAAEFVEAETGKGADALDRRPQLAAAPRQNVSSEKSDESVTCRLGCS